MSRRILTTAIFITSVFGLAGIANARADEACPKIEVDTPRPEEKFFGRGETYMIGAIVSPADQAEMRFNWELSPAISFKEVDPASLINPKKGVQYISFVATGDLQLTKINASVRVDGLPPQCPNTKTASFKVEFDTESPRVITQFPRNITKELVEPNLFFLTTTLKDADDGVIALIVLDYSKTDKKRTLRKLVGKISDLLIHKFNFPQNKFSFAFDQQNDKLVTAYGWPTERNHSWEINIERLDIPD